MIQNPGHWQHFLQRNDNRNLTVEQARQKYMKEQYLFEQFESHQMQQQMIMSNAVASGGSIITVPDGLPSNCVQFVANTTTGTTFYMTILNNLECNYTIDWGDGTVESDVPFEDANLSHTYEGEQIEYTVRLCFSNPEAVYSLYFQGND
jgi:hypothetical protein